MMNIVIPLFIGIVYGTGFYFIFINSIRFLKNELIKRIGKKQSANLIDIQVCFIYILSLLLGTMFLLTILFFSPYFPKWHSFVKVWVIGLSIGLYISALVGKRAT